MYLYTVNGTNWYCLFFMYKNLCNKKYLFKKIKYKKKKEELQVRIPINNTNAIQETHLMY